MCACIILSLDLGKISEPNHDLAYSTVFDSSFEITISRRWRWPGYLMIYSKDRTQLRNTNVPPLIPFNYILITHGTSINDNFPDLFPDLRIPRSSYSRWFLHLGSMEFRGGLGARAHWEVTIWWVKSRRSHGENHVPYCLIEDDGKTWTYFNI